MNDALKCEDCKESLPLGLATLVPSLDDPTNLAADLRICSGCFAERCRQSADDGRMWLGV